MYMIRVAAVVLTKNEEDDIEKCLSHLRPYVDYILVLDGESNDKTVEIAKKIADRVEIRPFSGSFAEERNYAQSLVDCDWILHVDVDEIFDKRFLDKIKDIVGSGDADSFRFPRKNIPEDFSSKWPDYQVRLLRKNKAVWKRPVHEIPYSKEEDKPIDQVSVVTLDEYPIIHRWW